MVYNGRWKSNQSKSHCMHTHTLTHNPRLYIPIHTRYLWLIRRFTLLGCASYQTACRSGFPAQCLVIFNMYIAVYLSYQNGLNLSTSLMKLLCQKTYFGYVIIMMRILLLDFDLCVWFLSSQKSSLHTHTHTYIYISYTPSQSLAL